MAAILDCLVVGAGPAGLTAGIYLGRFRRQALIADGGRSRADWIPRSHNLPGFPEGVEGPVLLERMRDQARGYGAKIVKARVDRLDRDDDGLFSAEIDGATHRARSVILATGVVETEPRLPDVFDATRRGLLRTCPICDAYEVTGKRIAIIGDSDHAAGEALFLRTYSRDVTLVLVEGGCELPPARRRALDEAGVRVNHAAIEGVDIEDQRITALCTEDGAHQFDAVYSAFGVAPQSGLAEALGARLDAELRLYADEHQATSVEGLYAAGDLVRGLNQISVANGEAAIAATAIHNRLPRNDA